MVETRAPGTEQISHRILTRTKRRKMAFFEGCPVGWGGGVPTGAGLVDGGVDQGPWLQERVGGGVGFQRRGRVGLGCSKQVQGRGQGRVGLAVGGGCKGFGCGGVGGRGTQGWSKISQRVLYFCCF